MAYLFFDEASIEAEPGTIIHGCPHRLLRFENLQGDTFDYITICYFAGEKQEGRFSRLDGTSVLLQAV